MHRLREIPEYILYRVLCFLVPLLPRGPMVWLARRLGGFYYWISPRTRRIGLENLRRVFPERTDHARILRQSVRLQAVALLDTLWCRRLTPESASRYFDVSPQEVDRFREAVAGNRGTVVATAHFGSWEMFNLGAGALDLAHGTVIVNRLRNARIDRHFQRARERTGNRVAYREQAFARCLAALRGGGVICSVIDVAVLPSEGGIYAGLMGTPAMTSAALPLLSVRRRAPLFFIVCRPLAGGRRYVLESEQIPVDPEPADREAETARVAAELNRALERRVRAHPECWLWSYKRWKWRPGELGQELYPDYSLWERQYF